MQTANCNLQYGVYEVKDYTPRERMNMLRSGARVRRLQELYRAKRDGFIKARIGSRAMGIETAIRHVEWQASYSEVTEAHKRSWGLL